jgi:hypothetical protein
VEKELHMHSKELRTAAATCCTERAGVGVDASWASEAMGGMFKMLRSHAMYFDR